MFSNQELLSSEALVRHAEAMGIDLDRFKSCLADPDVIDKIRAAATEAQRLNIGATPTFLIGTGNGNQVHVTRRIAGAQEYAVFEEAIASVAPEIAAKPSADSATLGGGSKPR